MNDKENEYIRRSQLMMFLNHVLPISFHPLGLLATEGSSCWELAGNHGISLLWMTSGHSLYGPELLDELCWCREQQNNGRMKETDCGIIADFT
jgi:hypothetical protein